MLDTSTLILIILTLISLLVIYLQHLNILPSPYFNHRNPKQDQINPSQSKQSNATCRHCSKLKPINQLKICSNCKTTTSNQLNFYYCDTKCQKLNWKTHKLICGNFKNLSSTTNLLPKTSSSFNTTPSKLDSFSLPSNNLFNPGLEKWKTEIEALLKRWCEYHRSLLIFATIHGLDLLRNPKNANQILLMISLNLKGDDDENPSYEKIISSTSEKGEDSDTPTLENGIEKKQKKDSNIHDLFSVAHIGSLDCSNFFHSNPAMLNAYQEMEKVKVQIKHKGGVGAAILLVRYGAIVHVIPVGLPSQADLDAVPRQKNWREIFDEAIKTGVPWKPPS